MHALTGTVLHAVRADDVDLLHMLLDTQLPSLCPAKFVREDDPIPSALLTAASLGRQKCLDLLLRKRPGDLAVTNALGMNAAHLVAIANRGPNPHALVGHSA